MTYVIRTHTRKDFKTCRLEWHYKKFYEPVTIPEWLEFGTAIHKGLETYYHDTKTDTFYAIDAFLATNDAQLHNHPYRDEITTIDEYEDRAELGKGMLDYYINSYAPAHDDFNVIAVEWPFEIPVYVPKGSSPPFINYFSIGLNGELYFKTKPVVYQGTIDLIVEKDGEIYIVDHKTTKAFKESTFHLDVDTQISSYAYAASLFLPKPPAGIIYNQLKKNYPQPPNKLQNGGLSKSKSQNTTFELYKQAIKDNDLPIEPYDEILNFLRNQGEKYVRRYTVERNSRELESQKEYIFQEAIDMLNDPFIYPTPSEMNCPSCPFKYPCLARQEGEDEQYILDNEDLFTPV